MILALVRRAIAGYGWRVIGACNGTLGLMKWPVDAVALSLDAADGTLLRRGGTILGSSITGEPRI